MSNRTRGPSLLDQLKADETLMSNRSAKYGILEMEQESCSRLSERTKSPIKCGESSISDRNVILINRLLYWNNIRG